MFAWFARRYLDVLGSIYIYNERRGYTAIDRVLDAVRARFPHDEALIAAIASHRADERKHYVMTAPAPAARRALRTTTSGTGQGRFSRLFSPGKCGLANRSIRCKLIAKYRMRDSPSRPRGSTPWRPVP